MSTFEPFRQVDHVSSTWGAYNIAARGLLTCALSARIDGVTEPRGHGYVTGILWLE